MSSRFTDTELWNEDWFCEMPGEYQLFLKYVFDKCDNAGVWKPNKFDFETKTKFKVSPDLLFKKVNVGQQRVLLLDNGRWFFTGYILFQWFNKKKSFDLVLSNRLHKSLFDIIETNKIPHEKVRGLREVLKTPMVMDMVKDGVVEVNAPIVENEIRGKVTFDAEKEILSNQLRFEQVCMKTSKNQVQAKTVLRKYHLWLAEKELYPKTPDAVFAGFEKWLMNEKKEKFEPAEQLGSAPLKRL